ncbi:hypothetical protein LCGC14_2568480 [marine sediment metagenome]|uniref:Uncharacterized protein n=1 Tax=marine sediment metagenome TaxID=412755 RepID=A0A0F9DAR9_9ZZZZ
MNGNPPVQLLSRMTRAQLGDFELWSLNQVANLRKEIRVAATEILEALWNTPIAQECIERKAEALLARWLLDNREELELAIRVPPDEFVDLEGSAVVDRGTVCNAVESEDRNLEIKPAS